MIARLRRLLASERGYTMIELLQVMVILGLILTALMTVFVRAMNSELEMNRRFTAQQEARLAVDKMRREIHCASAVTPTGNASSITITLPSQCPTSGGAQASIVYDTQLVSTGRYRLRRAGVRIADWIQSGSVFTYTAPAVGTLGKLHLDLPVNSNPTGSQSAWRLIADIVLRNTVRL
jgi:prepilin-type N-terminal cleavage/methylation domain-containing protein